MGTGYEVQSSNDLTDWQAVESGAITSDPQEFSFPKSETDQYVFYRLVVP
jgi:hypothetical protein